MIVQPDGYTEAALAECICTLVIVASFVTQRDDSMQDKLLDALKRAISALNMIPSFRTAEGIKSYELLAELDAIVRGEEGRTADSD